MQKDEKRELAHELANIATLLGLNVELLGQQLTAKPESAKYLERLKVGCDQLQKMVTKLRDETA